MVPRAAAESPELDRVVAQRLFDEGRQLMDSGDTARACEKFQESQRLEPSGGAAFNLAVCREQEGKVATAWTWFKAALTAARRDGREDRVTASEEHIKALEAKLPQLTVEVREPAADQQIKVGETALGSSLWGAVFPIDPGTYELTASAPGKQPWQSTLTIELGQSKTVIVPRLTASAEPTEAPAPAAAEAQQDAGTHKESGSDNRVAGWITAGAGVAAIGVGAAFGVIALDQQSQSDALCPTDNTCTPEGVQLSKDANTSAWVANISIGAGLVAVAVGTYLILTSSPAEQAAAPAVQSGMAWRVEPSAGFDGASLSLSGVW